MQTITKRIALMSSALMLIAGVGTADAQPRHGIVIVPRVGIYRPYVYAPYWGPWHSPAYAYTYGYPIGGDANIRTKVDPKNAEVFVDGYFAGFAREFDGGHRLHVTPGGHAITMHLDGYRTVTEEIWVEPSRTVTLKADMERLARGEVSAPVPSPTWPESREPR